MKRDLFILIVLAFAAISIFGTGNKILVQQDSIVSPEFTVAEASWVGPNIQTIDDYLSKYVRYPESSMKSKDMGTEVVEFVVTTEGELKDFRVINSVSEAIDKEMIRALVQTKGMWNPGLLNGIPVPMKKEVSLVFVPDESYDLVEIAKKHLDEANQELFVKKNARRALHHFDQAVKIFPYDKDILSLRSLCRYELGDKEGARDDWKRIINMRIGEATQLETGYLIIKSRQLKGYEELNKALEEGGSQ